MINLICPTKEMVMLALKVRGELANMECSHETTASIIDSDVNYWATGFILFKDSKDSKKFTKLSNHIRKLALLVGGDTYKWFSERKRKMSEEAFSKIKHESYENLKDLILIDDILEAFNALKYAKGRLIIENPWAFHKATSRAHILIRAII